MIVIIEGPDGAGKTTLARDLAERFGLEYRHEGPPPADERALWHYGRILEECRGRKVVLDRFALGERVYGPVLRHEDKLGSAGWRVFSRLTVAVGTIQVLCLPPPRTCHANWSNGRKPELFSDEIVFWKTYAEFAHIASDALKFGQHVYDYTATSVEELTYSWDSWHHHIQLPTGVIGAPAAEHLLVGEQVGDLEGPDLPFFSAWGSSQYLTDALDAAGFYDHELAWVNARTAAGEMRNFGQIMAHLSPNIDVVALGQDAGEILTRQGIAHRQVPHPQYWKRFHHYDMEGYARELRGPR